LHVIIVESGVIALHEGDAEHEIVDGHGSEADRAPKLVDIDMETVVRNVHREPVAASKDLKACQL